jgi:tetraacyldisaccharide 4'-kinase
MSRLSRFFLSTWQQRGLAAQILRPAAALYGYALRRKAARFDPQPTRPRPPIIVVGNAVVGGVGKTPIVIALVQHLQSLGYQPGVVSRGYGRPSKGAAVIEVLAHTPAAQAGDEPLLIAQATGAPVFVGANRPAALAALCAAHPQVNIVISDDGLQHWALPRDIEVLVWDGRGLGNGYLLPAGMLREPWPRQNWHPYAGKTPVLHLYAGGNQADFLPKETSWRVARRLANFALRADGSSLPLNSLVSQTLQAVAGIAQPEAFFADLRAQGLALRRTVALPDHADLAAWWQALPAAQQQATWLCTQKDAVKLWAVCPAALAVPLQVDLPAGFRTALAKNLKPSQETAHRQSASAA